MSSTQIRFARANFPGKGVKCIMQCTLCNEHIEDIEIQFGDAVETDGEFWHAECFAEYFGEVYEEVA